MAEIIRFPGVSRLDLNPNVILEEALKKGLQSAVVIGFDGEGEDFFSSSVADAGDVLYFLRRAEHRLMRMIDEQSGEK